MTINCFLANPVDVEAEALQTSGRKLDFNSGWSFCLAIDVHYEGRPSCSESLYANKQVGEVQLVLGYVHYVPTHRLVWSLGFFH